MSTTPDSQRLQPAPVIELRGLGIRYRRYTRKVTTLKEAAVSLFRGSQFDAYWAIRGLDLEVRQGESVGIIGPNGSGKSTLLKAICGVLPPCEGTVRTSGRIAPLLELGGGFSSELTGRENIFLNGAIMGCKRSEMKERLESIIAFADIGDFIDAPISTYSSGMRARLGFAVATDVDPDILLLDEVFAVGDASFSAKAMARTESFFRSQRTVITVSHSLPMIQRLCTRVIYLRAGRVLRDGAPAEVIQHYEQDVARQAKAAS